MSVNGHVYPHALGRLDPSSLLIRPWSHNLACYRVCMTLVEHSHAGQVGQHRLLFESLYCGLQETWWHGKGLVRQGVQTADKACHGCWDIWAQWTVDI